MNPSIDVALVDDWEVRGNGSGDPRLLQFEPMRQLIEIYDRHGLKCSFNVELLQQLTYRALQDKYPELRGVADKWDESVKNAFRKGHDIQLHLHPQWKESEYLGNLAWKLMGDWSLINYPEEEIRAMTVAGVKYLEQLLGPIDPNYRCVSYRSGSWCAAPSENMFPILAELGFVFDMSIVAGLRFDTPKVKLDYSICEESFRPYYPVMRDARRISQNREPMVCIPTHAFRGARLALFLRDVKKGTSKVRQKLSRPRATAVKRGVSGDEWTNKNEAGILGKARKFTRRYTQDELIISDLSRLDFGMMKIMLADIRERARLCGAATVPVILENHTKDIVDFSDIARFAELISTQTDIKTVTLSEIARNLQSGRYEVLTASSKRPVAAIGG